MDNARADARDDGPAVLVDVDGVLNPDAPARHLAAAGYQAHRYTGPDPDGLPVELDVWLHPDHGAWLRGLADAGASLWWATTWGPLAPAWIAPRLGLPAMGVIDVGRHGGARWGRSLKSPAVRAWAAARPFAWLDDGFAGRDPHWAEDRTAAGAPTLLVPVDPFTGLTRADVDQVARWLAAL